MSITWIVLLSSATTAVVFGILGAISSRKGPWYPWTMEQDNNLIVRFSRFEQHLKKEYNIHDACGCDDCESIPQDTPEQMMDKLTMNFIRLKISNVYDVSMDWETGDILIKRKKVTNDQVAD